MKNRKIEKRHTKKLENNMDIFRKIRNKLSTSNYIEQAAFLFILKTT